MKQRAEVVVVDPQNHCFDGPGVRVYDGPFGQRVVVVIEGGQGVLLARG